MKDFDEEAMVCIFCVQVVPKDKELEVPKFAKEWKIGEHLN